MATSIKINVAVGELIDKITILQIKEEKINCVEKQKNITRELSILAATRTLLPENDALTDLEKQLKITNQRLWVIEDEIRLCESQQCFDDEFIKLARAVYQTNDHRCKIKRQINVLFDSEIIEEKSYQVY